MSKNYQLLDQFIDRKCEISFHSLPDNILSATYIYNQFSYQLDDDRICLLDQNDEDCETYIPIDDITEITNLTDDLYTTVVDIKFRDKIISICCAEEVPVPVKCDKCGHVFEDDEQIWYINQQGEYGSIYDNEWISKKLCDRCLSELLGKCD